MIENFVTYFPIVFLVLIIFTFIVVFLGTHFSRIPYQKAKILTRGELRFYKVLRYIHKGKYDIFSQVRLADLVEIPGGFVWKHFNRLGLKTVDFVICDKDTGETLLVIELDDKSHHEYRRIRRDKFVDDVLRTAGIPILHYRYKSYYDEKELLEIIGSYL